MLPFNYLLPVLFVVLFLSGCIKEEAAPNRPPVVNLGNDTTIILLNNLKGVIRLSGSASDADGSVVAYLWSQISGPNVTIISPGSTTTDISGFTAGTYEFQLMATDEKGATGSNSIKVIINLPPIKTLTLQPNPSEGQDAIVAVREYDGGANANGNHSYIPELNMMSWTYNLQGWGSGINRSYIKFTGLSALPADALIKSAKISFYGISESDNSPASPEGNSNYPGSWYNENSSWIKRVVGGDWDEGTIKWVNMPITTDVHRVAIPASNRRWNYDVLDLDITELVKDIQSSGRNYGFCLQLQTEQIYRSLMFASSEYSNPVKRPKLVIEYE